MYNSVMRSGNGLTGQKFTVTDGKLVLLLHVAEEGGYVVTAPFEQGLVTQAESVEEAFEMAYDALQTLRLARKDLAKQRRQRPRETVTVR